MTTHVDEVGNRLREERPEVARWEERARRCWTQQEGETEREWALRLLGELENEHRWHLYHIGEGQRLGRVIEKLQRRVNKLRLKAKPVPEREPT